MLKRRVPPRPGDDLASEGENPGEAAPALESARKDLVESARKLARAEVDSVLQSEVLTSLIDGRRTLAELVEGIYGVKKESPEYQAYYARVRRAVKNLSSKGLVSEGILRKDTPYRITKYGVAKLSQIGEPAKEYSLISREDYVLFALSAALLAAVALARYGVLRLGVDGLKVAFSLFFVFGGASLLRFSQIVRNVM